MRKLSSLLRQLVSRTEAQDLIEYGVLIGLIAAAVIVTAGSLGVKVPGLYTTTAAALPGESDPGGGSPGNGNPGRGGNPGNGNPGNGNPVGNPGSGNPGRGGGNGN